MESHHSLFIHLFFLVDENNEESRKSKIKKIYFLFEKTCNYEKKIKALANLDLICFKIKDIEINKEEIVDLIENMKKKLKESDEKEDPKELKEYLKQIVVKIKNILK